MKQNVIYKKTKKGNKEVKTFANGQLEEAMNYGRKQCYNNVGEEFFIITENDNCLKFNRTIII